MSESSAGKPTLFIQHLADNADHNSRTFDGCSTFHGMEIKCPVTPVLSSSNAIQCLEDASAEGLIRLTKIEQKTFPSSRRLLKLTFIELNEQVNAFDLLTSVLAAS